MTALAPIVNPIHETWFRPNLEPFDINYNRKHQESASRLPFVDLIIDNQGWLANAHPAQAIITTETLYFPTVVG